MRKKRTVGFYLTHAEAEKFNEVVESTGLQKIQLFRQRMLEQDKVLELINTKFDTQSREISHSIEWYIEQAINNLLLSELKEMKEIMVSIQERLRGAR
ncbi:MAG: hypothetical protein NTW78_12535 [Campylobacterales bacterium]|nr:hypothetical protein [Campylobacterales bacterium]